MQDIISGEVSSMIAVTGSLSALEVISGAVSSGGGSMLPAYEGPVELTPGDTDQVLATKNTTLLDDITISAIPAGYGKITWDGHALTVS